MSPDLLSGFLCSLGVSLFLSVLLSWYLGQVVLPLLASLVFIWGV